MRLNLKAMLASVRDTIGGSGRFYRWGNTGQYGNFPNIIIDSVNDSGTARECIDKLETFIAGQGIRYKELLDSPANSEQTWGQLIEVMDATLAYFDCVPIQVLYNNAGQAQHYHVLPVQHIRKRHDGKFLYRVGLGDEPGYHRESYATPMVVPPYDPTKSPREILKMVAGQIDKYGQQVGMLLYVYKPGIGLLYNEYPVPKWSAGLNDINADAALSLHEESQVSNSFKAGVIIQTEKLDRVNEDDAGKTEYEYFKEEIERFTSPDGSSVLHIEGINENAAAQVYALNIQHQMDATEKATDRIGRKVCRLFSVPPVLNGFVTAGKLGDNQELVNYMKLFMLTLEKKWRLKKRALHTLFPNLPAENFETIPLNLFDYLPSEVIKLMSPRQLREAFNLPEDKEHTEGSQHTKETPQAQ